MSKSHDLIATALVEEHGDKAIEIVNNRIDEWGGLSVKSEDNDCGAVVGFWDPDMVVDAVCRIFDK